MTSVCNIYIYIYVHICNAIFYWKLSAELYVALYIALIAFAAVQQRTFAMVHYCILFLTTALGLLLLGRTLSSVAID